MNYRTLGKTGWRISEISLGTWQVGGRWGSPFNQASAEQILHKAIDLGINFIDTADVYSQGLSESVVGKVVRQRPEEVYVATKCGRQLNPHTAEGYNEQNIRHFVDQSLQNSGLEKLDLIQLHCPPTAVYEREEVFGVLEQLKQEGKIRHFGVSVEKVSEAMRALQYPGLASVQIIFNMFRHKPAEAFFVAAKAANVGILARVPLASGLLSGKYSRHTHFAAGDHRHFNRKGEAFDKGETFSGVDYEQGLEAVEALKKALHAENKLHLYALKWILMFEEVSCVIPGASRVEQVVDNVAAAELPPLTAEQMQAVRAIYERYFRAQVHHQW
ncbi:MAG: aldo/keto reductase [Bacteroidetes bacterium]|nr:MAG: aldo/keto reductase [Bacteroidota bacterium]